MCCRENLNDALSVRTYEALGAGRQPVRNPPGPDDSYDPTEPATAQRAMRGGSYRCSDQYCSAYEAGERGQVAPEIGYFEREIYRGHSVVGGVRSDRGRHRQVCHAR
jgi:hypothetical protein